MLGGRERKVDEANNGNELVYTSCEVSLNDAEILGYQVTEVALAYVSPKKNNTRRSLGQDPGKTSPSISGWADKVGTFSPHKESGSRKETIFHVNQNVRFILTYYPHDTGKIRGRNLDTLRSTQAPDGNQSRRLGLRLNLAQNNGMLHLSEFTNPGKRESPVLVVTDHDTKYFAVFSALRRMHTVRR
ncbi:hypothetical protein L218DRAFT_986676 [Marasmius fiardii PR-910]|nr:hypothetical protein L218DRAFT_986676 [Marasmius fiardii PR-910]